MKQSHSAITLLVRAYRSILRNSYRSSVAAESKRGAVLLAAFLSLMTAGGVLPQTYAAGFPQENSNQDVYEAVDINSDNQSDYSGQDYSFEHTGSVLFHDKGKNNGAFSVRLEEHQYNFTITSAADADGSGGDAVFHALGKSGINLEFLPDDKTDKDSSKLSGSFSVNASGSIIAVDGRTAGSAYGLMMKSGIDVSLTAQKMIILQAGTGYSDGYAPDGLYIDGINSGDLFLEGKGILISGGDGVDSNNGTGDITFKAGDYGITVLSGAEGDSASNAFSHTGQGTVSLTSTGQNVFAGGQNDGLRLVDSETKSFTLEGRSNLAQGGQNGLEFTNSYSAVKISASGGSNYFIGDAKYGIGVSKLKDGAELSIKADKSNVLWGGENGLSLSGAASISLTAGTDNYFASSKYGISAAAGTSETSSGSFTAKGSNYVTGGETAVASEGSRLSFEAANNYIGIGQQDLTLKYSTYQLDVPENFDGNKDSVNVYYEGEGQDADDAYNYKISSTEQTISKSVPAAKVGITAKNDAVLTFKASESNQVVGSVSAVSADSGAELTFTAGELNYVSAAAYYDAASPLAETQRYTAGLGLAVEVSGGSKLKFYAPSNVFAGRIEAEGDGTELKIGAAEDTQTAFYDSTALTNVSNIFAAGWAADVQDQGESTLELNDYSSAVQAADGASIEIKAQGSGQNYIASYAKLPASFLDEESSGAADGENEEADASFKGERAVWAQTGGSIKLEGSTTIITSLSGINTKTEADHGEGVANSIGIALAAGEADVDEYAQQSLAALDPEQSESSAETAVIELNYGKDSYILGDAAAGLGGSISIKPQDDSASLRMQGNLLAANGGSLELDLGQDGVLIGRSDYYSEFSADHETIYSPALSSSIFSAGEVKLTLGAGSAWYLTGQSWVSELKGPESGTALVDFNGAQDSSTSGTASALTIDRLTGGNICFNMNLSGNRAESDMLYIGYGEGEYTINLTSVLTAEDIVGYNGQEYDGLRFATVGAGSNITFNVVTKDRGVLDHDYGVFTDSYDEHPDNEAYNGTELDHSKPGNDNVNKYFADSADSQVSELNSEAAKEDGQENGSFSSNTKEQSNETLQETTDFKLMLTSSSSDDEENGGDGGNNGNNGNNGNGNNGNGNNGGNGQQGPSAGGEIAGDVQLSDAGRTVVSMSRANYAMAVYMDTLNKRQGESRINVNGEDHGLWLRYRFDNIGRDSAYRVHNSMLELGYDFKTRKDEGSWHTGIVLDYMKGSVDYRQVRGDGDIDRWGIWAYATYLGDNGFYADLVMKYGHLDNEFTVYAQSTGERISGDYHNNVISVSAETGYKFINEDGWFAEPQVQLQFSRVGSASYETSQGTQVELDKINSLIGRAGVRLGRDLLEDGQSWGSFYLRADVLKEFLGDQDITASDDTGRFSETYDNDDVYFDVGLGISLRPGRTTSFFVEAEQILGADFDDSYVMQVGVRQLF